MKSLEEKMLVSRPMSEEIEINPDSGANSSGTPRAAFIVLGEERIIEVLGLDIEDEPWALDGRPALEFVQGDVDAGIVESLQRALDPLLANTPGDIPELGPRVG